MAVGANENRGDSVFTWIESWYNPRRRHSGLNYQLPNNFQRKHQEDVNNTESQIIHELQLRSSCHSWKRVKSNVRWCSDGLELSCYKGEKVCEAFALNCCDGEIMSWVATTKGIDAALVGDLMMQSVVNRFGPDGKPPKPIEWLTDNGSCYTAAEIRSFAKQLGLNQ